MLHYLWLVDVSRSSSQLIASILRFLNHWFIVFSQYYFNRFICVGLPPHCLNRDLLTLILLLVSSQVIFNQHFCRWQYFLSYWFVKREYGKFTNGIPVIGGPTRLPRPHGHIVNYIFLYVASECVRSLLFLFCFRKTKLILYKAQIRIYSIRSNS